MENIKGIDFILEVQQGTTFIQVGGQQGATLNRSKESIETTSKDSAGWRNRVGGIKEWGIEADGLLVINNQGYRLLEDSFMNDTPLIVRIGTPSGQRFSGEAIVTDFPLEAGFEDMATYSVTLEGCGALRNI